MRRFLTLIAAVGISVGVGFGITNTAHAQRSFGAQTFVMDDGAGHTYTMMTPTGMTGNITYQFPTPPPGNPPAGFVNVGTAGQTLYWNAAAGHLDWEASSAITNNGSGAIGVNGNLTIANSGGTGLTFNNTGAGTQDMLGSGSNWSITKSGQLTLGGVTPYASNEVLVGGLDGSVTGDAHQIIVTNNATAGGLSASSMLEVGLNTSGATPSGAIQAFHQTVGPLPLALQPAGGSISINRGTTAPVATLDLNGTLNVTQGAMVGNGLGVSLGLTVNSGPTTLTPLNVAGVVHNSATGLLSTGLVSLTTDVTGILPIANGGTGSNTQNFVDLTTAQTVGGNKSFTGTTTLAALTQAGTTNINTTTGATTSIGTGGTGVVNIGNATGNTVFTGGITTNPTTNVTNGGGDGETSGSLNWDVSAPGYAVGVLNTGGSVNSDGLIAKTTGTAATNKIFTATSGGTDRFSVNGDGSITAPGAFNGGAGSFTTLTSSGNSTIGTGASTINSFGNAANATNNIGNGGGGTSSNNFGNNANNNQFGGLAATNTFGNNATTLNQFGHNSSNNDFGNGATTNTYGNSILAAVGNTFGSVTGGSGTATNTIGTAIIGSTANTTIGGGGGTSSVTLNVGATAGSVTVNGAHNVNGVTTQTGNFNLAGATSQLQMQGAPGAANSILQSNNTNTPSWTLTPNLTSGTFQNLFVNPLTTTVGLTIGAGSSGNDITGNSWNVNHGGGITSTALNAGAGTIQTTGTGNFGTLNSTGTTNLASAGTAAVSIATGSTGNTNIGNTTGNVSITGAIVFENGDVKLNSSGPAASEIGAGIGAGSVTIGNVNNATHLLSANTDVTGNFSVNATVGSGTTSIGTGGAAGAINLGRTGGSTTIAGSTTLSGLATAGVVHNDATGLLSTSLIATGDIGAAAVDLTSQVTGILPVANGGTGSNTQNFVDLTTAQSVGGNKSFTGTTTLAALTQAGTANINTSGSAATTIGDGTGTVALSATNWSISTAGGFLGTGVNANSGTIQTTGSIKAGTLNGAAASAYTQGSANGSVAVTTYAGNVSLFTGSTSVTLTNANITANSVVMPVVVNTTPTMYTCYVSAIGSGTTTIQISAAADAATSVGYIIVNP